VGNDRRIGAKLIEIISTQNHVDDRLGRLYVTETQFNKQGMERRTTSDFGFIGWIITQFAAD